MWASGGADRQSDVAYIGPGAFTGHAGDVRFAGGEVQGDIDGVADFVITVHGDAITGVELYFGS